MESWLGRLESCTWQGCSKESGCQGLQALAGTEKFPFSAIVFFYYYFFHLLILFLVVVNIDS